MRTRQQILDYLKKYRQAHPERIAAQKAQWYRDNRERERKKRRQHYNANKEIYKARARRRVSKIKGSDTRLYTKEQILAKTVGYCYLCDCNIDTSLKWPDPASFSFHHIIPTSTVGTDDMDNVVATHLTCNISAGNRLNIRVEKLRYSIWQPQ